MANLKRHAWKKVETWFVIKYEFYIYYFYAAANVHRAQKVIRSSRSKGSTWSNNNNDNTMQHKHRKRPRLTKPPPSQILEIRTCRFSSSGLTVTLEHVTLRNPRFGVTKIMVGARDDKENHCLNGLSEFVRSHSN
jgi:hypothetical protein